MFCLLWIIGLLRQSVFAEEEFPPFTNDQLPRERVINLWRPTNGQKIFVPFHFGPSGTTAWETFFISFAFLPNVQYGITDCYCGGDEFLLQTYTPTYGNVITVSPIDPEVRCNQYSEEFFGACLEGNAWAHTETSIDNTYGPFANITISTLNSPYGGGIGWFWYLTPY